MPIRCRVPEAREARGLTQTELARQVGISRQALGAIESGRSVPNTAVSLQLARVLGRTVEQLFVLDDLPDLRVPGLEGRRVALGRTGETWFAHALGATSTEPADGIVRADGGIDVHADRDALERTLFVAGCAPVLGVLTGHVSRPEHPVRWLQAPSSRALGWLAEGRTHLAGVHLADLDAPGTHDALVRETLGDSAAIVPLVGWREGLATRPDTRLGGVEDLAHLRVARRPAGSGAARVLTRALERVGLCEADVQGPAAATHQDATLAVVHGQADVAVVIEPVARAWGLDFLPLAEERFELVLRSGQLTDPGVQRLLGHLRSPGFAREVRAMGPYETDGLGSDRRVEPA